MRFVLAAAAVSITFVAAPGAQAARVVPNEAVPDATVALRGGDLPKMGKVTVAGKRAEVVSRTKSRIRFVVPRVRPGARSVRIRDTETTMRVLTRFRGNVGIKLAKNRSKEREIGPGGGSITARHDGITYTLEVPAGALGDPTQITLTPVSKLTNLPLKRNRPAAVQLQPDGLELAVPAELSIEGLENPGRQVGFTMTDEGRGLEIFPAERRGKRVVVELVHFSTPGAAGPTVQDFVNIFSRFLNSTQATLTLGELEEVLGELVAAQSHFPGFCATQAICDEVKDRARSSVEEIIREVCDRQSEGPTNGGTSLLFDLAAQIPLLGGDEAVPDCVRDFLEALAAPAVENVRTTPFTDSDADFQLHVEDFRQADLDGDGIISWLEWVFLLSGKAGRFAYEELRENLTDEFANAMDKALADGRQLCESTERSAGRELLLRGFAIARATGFRESEFQLALIECEGPGDITFTTRTGRVYAAASVVRGELVAEDGPFQEELVDDLAAFSESVSASASFPEPPDSASGAASQTSSIALTADSLRFDIAGTVDGTASLAEETESTTSGTGITEAEVTFVVNTAVPYSLTGSMSESGVASRVIVTLHRQGGDDEVHIDSDVSTSVPHSGTLLPGEYDITIEASATPTADEGTSTGDLDLAFLIG